jgi:hypothetical protein
MKRVFWGLVALGLFLGAAGQAKADYLFTTFDPPGSTLTIAYGINDSGQIVGYYTAGGTDLAAPGADLGRQPAKIIGRSGAAPRDDVASADFWALVGSGDLGMW